MKNQRTISLRVLTLVFFFSLFADAVVAQNQESEHHVYLLSNLESLSPDATEFTNLKQHLSALEHNFTVLILGDFVDENGLGTNPEAKDLAKVDSLLSLSCGRGNLVFIPGDREWDNGRKRGLKKLKALEKYLESKTDKGKIIFPRKGCLGPSIIDIDKHIRIAAINTQWFLEENIRPEEEDADCGLLNESAFWSEMQDVLENSDNRNLIIAGHHPVISYGQYAGYRLAKQHFSPPLVGSLIASYRQNVGGKRDLNNKNLKVYRNGIHNLAEQFPGAIYVAGHEYDNQLLYDKGNYYISSGAFVKGKPVGRGTETLFRSKKPGFTKLVFKDDGVVQVEAVELSNGLITSIYQKQLYSAPCKMKTGVAVNPHYNPCKDQFVSDQDATSPSLISGNVVASERYKGGLLKRMILGEHYRDTWAEEIKDVPYLDLKNFAGGLKPYGKGGGAQTKSLKFESADGRRFSFRSIDKNPTQRMDQELAAGLWGTISRDKTSHQHPYGMLGASYLQESYDIPHTQPQLFLMPDDPSLGPWRKDFAGLFGTLEIKPQGKKKTDNPYQGAYDVDHTLKMYQKLLKDNDNKIDVPRFVRARLFDMWVSDWDRHIKNYKWLAYKNDKGEYNFRVFPKDRDKAFSKMNGMLWLVQAFHFQKDKVTFSKSRYGLKYLNFKNRTMDRWLANSFTEEDWMKEVEDFQKAMTDEVILEALDQLPPEVQKHDREDIFERLKARREMLPRKIKKYYKWLAKYIDLVGSDSRELFEVERLPGGDVRVKVYDTNKKEEKQDLLYERLFKRKETKEIRLYGLGKSDFFRISGDAKNAILVRVIGGKGKDVVEDKTTGSSAKRTLVYDKRNQDKLSLGNAGKKKNTQEILKFSSEEFFSYNYLQVLPSLAFNQDDGLVLGLTGTYTRQAFNKKDYSARYIFSGSVTTNQNYNFNVQAQYRHVIGELDFLAGVNLSSWDRSFRRFYGLSNENVIDDDLRELDFYENRTGTLRANLGLRREFWGRSNIILSAQYDVREVDPNPKDDGGVTIYDAIPKGNGRGTTPLIGPGLSVNIDLRDNPNFPTKGLQWTASGFHFWNLDDAFEDGGRLETELSAFFTAGVKIPVTLSLRPGFISTYGDLPFYHKAYIGQVQNHRGFRRNRFGGDDAFYLNSDLRIHLGKVITPLVPIKYGIFGLFDLGRTWSENESSDEWHSAVGGGIYLIPYADNFNLTFTAAKSKERGALYSFRIGFFVR